MIVSALSYALGAICGWLLVMIVIGILKGIGRLIFGPPVKDDAQANEASVLPSKSTAKATAIGAGVGAAVGANTASANESTDSTAESSSSIDFGGFGF